MIKKILMTVFLLAVVVFTAGCSTDADVVSENLSKAADQFQVLRRVVFYNGITGEYMLEITGYCSLGNNDSERQRTITCKTGPDTYKKHFLGLSDNVTYFAEQVNDKNVSKDYYKVIFKPTTIIPDVDIK